MRSWHNRLTNRRRLLRTTITNCANNRSLLHLQQICSEISCSGCAAADAHIRSEIRSTIMAPKIHHTGEGRCP
jgi:hypothetical protein